MLRFLHLLQMCLLSYLSVYPQSFVVLKVCLWGLIKFYCNVQTFDNGFMWVIPPTFTKTSSIVTFGRYLLLSSGKTINSKKELTKMFLYLGQLFLAMSVCVISSSSSSIGTATLVGYGLLNCHWVFSAGRFLQSAVASGMWDPQLGGPVIRTFQLRPPGVPHVWNPAAEGGTMGEKLPRILPKVATSTSLLGSFTCLRFTTWDRRLQTLLGTVLY